MAGPSWRALFLAAVLIPGCDFFKELKSEESATTTEGDTDTDTDTDTGLDAGTEAGPCTIEHDDYCANQDELHSCDPQNGEVSVFDCGALCGIYTNFTCLNAGNGQHGCWCVEPGKQKVYSCWELEGCLIGCVNATGDTCANQCFSRTTQSTARMYGALIHCAHSACDQLCFEDPYACSSCIETVRGGSSGGCGLERSVCDADQNDEPGP